MAGRASKCPLCAQLLQRPMRGTQMGQALQCPAEASIVHRALAGGVVHAGCQESTARWQDGMVCVNGFMIL